MPRDSKKDAAIGVTAGIGAGVLSSILTHPIDSHVVRSQSGNAPSYSAWKAPFKKEMWHGAGGSALKKGLNYGISMGITFGLASIIRNALDKHNMHKLGFHRAK